MSTIATPHEKSPLEELTDMQQQLIVMTRNLEQMSRNPLLGHSETEIEAIQNVQITAMAVSTNAQSLLNSKR